MALVTIGQTTALIPEAGSAVQPEWLNDGQSGNTNFPYSSYKALATVGEVDAKTKQGLTGYPDGQAAWLLDNDTVRVAYQSESYAHIYGRTPAPETYPQEMKTGVTFSGSKIHTIDYSREAFADFMGNDSAASDMVEGSGFLFNRVFNLFGEEVTPKNTDPEDKAAKWATRPCLPVISLSFMPLFQSRTSTSTPSAEPGTSLLIVTAKDRASVMTSG